MEVRLTWNGLYFQTLFSKKSVALHCWQFFNNSQMVCSFEKNAFHIEFPEVNEIFEYCNYCNMPVDSSHLHQCNVAPSTWFNSSKRTDFCFAHTCKICSHPISSTYCRLHCKKKQKQREKSDAFLSLNLRLHGYVCVCSIDLHASNHKAITI